MTGIGSLGFTSEMVRRAIDGGAIRVATKPMIAPKPAVPVQPAQPSYANDTVFIPVPPSKEGITTRILSSGSAAPIATGAPKLAPAKIVVSPNAPTGSASGATLAAETASAEAAPAKPPWLTLALLAWSLFS